jgi:hypothetical protein
MAFGSGQTRSTRTIARTSDMSWLKGIIPCMGSASRFAESHDDAA